MIEPQKLYVLVDMEQRFMGGHNEFLLPGHDPHVFGDFQDTVEALKERVTEYNYAIDRIKIFELTAVPMDEYMGLYDLTHRCHTCYDWIRPQGRVDLCKRCGRTICAECSQDGDGYCDEHARGDDYIGDHWAGEPA